MNNVSFLTEVEYFNALPNTEKFTIIVSLIAIFVVFTRFTTIHAGHIFAFSVGLLYFTYINRKGTSNDSKINILYSQKLNDIIEYVKFREKIYLQNDIQAIRLLDIIKYNFTSGNTNKRTFKSIVNALNRFYKTKNTLETKVCYGVKSPELLKNWTDDINDFSFRIDCSKKRSPYNIKELFEEATKQGKLAINYTHSLIINTQSNNVKHAIHQEIYQTMRELVYKELNSLYRTVKRQKILSKQELDLIMFDFKIFNKADNLILFEKVLNDSFVYEL